MQKQAACPRGWFGVHQWKCAQCPHSCSVLCGAPRPRTRAPAYQRVRLFTVRLVVRVSTYLSGEPEPGSGLRGVLVIVPALAIERATLDLVLVS